MSGLESCGRLLAGIGPLCCCVIGPHRTHTYESTSVMDGRHDDAGNGD